MFKKFLFVSLLLLLAGCTAAAPPDGTVVSDNETAGRFGRPIDSPRIEHLHGMVLSADGEVLTLATHHGLFHWTEGQWHESAGTAHDHMGFSASVASPTSKEGAYYTSGHPAPGSGLRNPLGLMRSTDFGKTWETLSLSGEADFHLMASSTDTLTIYAWTMAPNSQMPEPGLYFTKDGLTWDQSTMSGLNADPLVLIVHPFQGGTVLASTTLGTFISEDYGQNFELLTETFFTAGDFMKGADILFGATLDAEGNSGLVAFDLQTETMKALTLPELQPRELTAYLTVSPLDSDVIFLATSLKNVFVSRDGGMSWEQILEQSS